MRHPIGRLVDEPVKVKEGSVKELLWDNSPMTKTFNIASHLVEMARRQPDTTAIIVPWGRHGGSLTYQQLDDRSSRISRGMEKAGIGRGVRAALMVQPGLDLFALAFALFKCGAIPVLIDPGIGI